MADEIRDARLRELAFLANLERQSGVRLASEALHNDHVLRSMVIQLLYDGYVNGLDCLPWNVAEVPTLLGGGGGKPNVQVRFELRLWGEIARVLGDQEIALVISHKGRVRRSELEQALRTGRDRDPFGVVWDVRHRDQAVTIALLSAQAGSPVSLAYLDMNGLKKINDENDHGSGDVVIKTYLQTISMLMGERAEAFRSGGSDEVVVVMRNTEVKEACDSMRNVLMQLGKERVQVTGKQILSNITASCGVVSTDDPATHAKALIGRADAQQQRAKRESKARPGASFLAVEGIAEVEMVGVP